MVEVVAQGFGGVADAPSVQGVGEGGDGEGGGQAHDDEDDEKLDEGETSVGTRRHGVRYREKRRMLGVQVGSGVAVCCITPRRRRRFKLGL